MLEILLLIVLVFVGNTIQMIGAFAGTMLTMPFAILLVGVDTARVVLNGVGFAACICVIIKYHRSIVWREVIKIALVMIIGIIAGALIVKAYSSDWLIWIYALMVIGVAVKNLVVKHEISLSKPMEYVVLFGAGVIHGMYVSGGALLVIYAMHKFKDKTEFRATLSMVWIFMNSGLLAMHTAQNLVTPERLRLIIICTLPALFGSLFGEYIQKSIDGKKFTVFANCLLIAAGVTLLAGKLPF